MSIQKLYQISQKNEKFILGLMSGTSLDGLDMALCKISQNGLNTALEVLQYETIEYSEDFKNEIQSVFCKENVSLEKVCLLNNYVGVQYAQIINATLQKWNIKNSDVDIIASHGQTIYHSPKHKHQNPKFGNATLQIGDADVIAHNTNIITISDFRQKHIAAGGSGAPLAVYGDYFLLSNKNENRILVNIGGIANFTYLPKSQNFDEVFCTDVGAGNTLMDGFVQQHFNMQFDKDGLIAQDGIVNNDLLAALFNHSFFEQPFPKSTGQEIFNATFLNNALQQSNTTQINPQHIVATLNMFTAQCITKAIQHTVYENNYAIYISGGGVNNKLLLQNIQQMLPAVSISSTSKLGVNPNAKEAILFAILANETLNNTNEFYNNVQQQQPKIRMGKISLPQ